MPHESVLRPGKNCWRTAQSRRVAFLIDGAAYFARLRAAFLQAQRSILIVGWDADSRTRLVRDAPEDQLPVELGPFLDALVRRRAGLHVHILLWDFAMIYAFERQALPTVQFGWRTHRNVQIRLDGNHPLGASHHQKIVVVDDALAFAGGLDLTDQRWDTPEHRPADPRRVSVADEPYQPFHDVQVMVEGPAASALADLARARWRGATGRQLQRDSGDLPQDRWPTDLQPDLRDVEVGIARTEPPWGASDGVREVEQLHLDLIRAATRQLYIENQFLTSASIGDELSRSLQRDHGPEIVVVGPQRGSGWLEQATMDVLRSRMVGRLREADRHGRLRLMYPAQAGLPAGQSINVHSKVVVVDDRVARVGSANLSNRSQGIDTECDLAFEASSEEHRRAVAALRDRLLAEHLGRDPGEVEQAIARHGLVGAVDRLRGGDRTLEEMEHGVPEWLDDVVPESDVVDPERPIEYDAFVASVIPHEFRHSDSAPLLTRLHLWTALSALLIAWPMTFLEGLLPLRSVLYFGLEGLRWPCDSLVVAALYLVGAVFPLNMITVITVFLFGGGQGLPYALGGVLLSALTAFGLGRMLGRDRLRRVTSAPIDRLGTQLAQARLLTLAKLRWVPFVSFHLVNLASGAWHTPFRRFLLSVLFGVFPGTLFSVLFAVQLARTILAPGGWNGALLLTLLAAMYGIALWLHRRLTG